MRPVIASRMRSAFQVAQTMGRKETDVIISAQAGPALDSHRYLNNKCLLSSLIPLPPRTLVENDVMRGAIETKGIGRKRVKFERRNLYPTSEVNWDRIQN